MARRKLSQPSERLNPVVFAMAYTVSSLGVAFALAFPGPPLPPPPLPSLPFVVPEDKWRPLRDTFDPVFQAKLDRRLRQNSTWRALIDENRMTVGVVDMREPSSPRFAHINGDTMLYSASLPKIGVLLAVFDAMESGTLVANTSVDEQLADMIQHSSNPAATYLIDTLGITTIDSVLMDPQYGFYDEERGGGIWIGRRYAPEGAIVPDPVKGLSHGANATQVCRFYYQLATGRLINSERSRQMLEILSQTHFDHKFVYSLSRLSPGVPVYRKSGTWKIWHSDSMLVWGDVWRCYILVALVEDRGGEQILRDLVPVIESVIVN